MEKTGEVVSQVMLARRVGWLAALAGGLAAGVVAARWNTADLDALASGIGLDGRVLPSKGWMALRRLGWDAPLTPGASVSDRVVRCAQEQAARSLRLASHRRAVVAVIVASWPADPRARTDVEWQALRALLPEGVTAAQIRGRTRQIRAFVQEQGRLPSDLTEVEDSPKCAAQIVLAAADRS